MPVPEWITAEQTRRAAMARHIIGTVNMGYTVIAAIPGNSLDNGDFYVTATSPYGRAVTWHAVMHGDSFVFDAGAYFENVDSTVNRARALRSMVERAGI